MVGEMLNNLQRPEEQKKKGGFFSKHEKAASKSQPISQEMESTINRLRVMEERYTNVQTELKLTEDNMIHKGKRLTADIKTINSEINELKKEINEIKDRVLMILKEMQGFARKEDVNVLKRYMEMWEPLNFATHKEVEEIIGERLREKG